MSKRLVLSWTAKRLYVVNLDTAVEEDYAIQRALENAINNSGILHQYGTDVESIRFEIEEG